MAESVTIETVPVDSVSMEAPIEQKISKKELKRRAKAARKAEEKAKRVAERAKTGSADEVVLPTMDQYEYEKLDYKDKRLADFEQLKAVGLEVYPHKFYHPGYEFATPRTLVEKFGDIPAAEHLEDQLYAVEGRIYSIRASSNALVFFDLHDEGHKIQIMANKRNYNGTAFEETKLSDEDAKTRNNILFKVITKILRPGDIVGVCGFICKTKLGELSIMPHYMQILSPCLHQLPRGVHVDEDGNEKNGLKDTEVRYRQRYLDMIVNDHVPKIFRLRSEVVKFVRRYLEDMGFIEVDTPVLDTKAGGATAKPFITESNDYKIPMYMRVAPELYLKMVVIGGINRVFEIGRQFRNESSDMTHNPEFTSCEFYMRNADFNDLMDINEDMYRGLVTKLSGSAVVPLTLEDGTTIEIDFGKPFDRIDMIPALAEAMDVEFPDPSTFESSEALAFFDSLCVKHGVDCSPPRTAARLLDKLVGHFIESKCINPTFLYGHPQVMSHLAKWDRKRAGITERFELFINGMEYANAYTELNDPKKQLECFQYQDKDRLAGDDEAPPVDESFVKALEHGLPPTGGWGCGVDRLCMLLSNVSTIREVILFPTMKPLHLCHVEEKVEETKSADVSVKASAPSIETVPPPPVPKILVSNKTTETNGTHTERQSFYDAMMSSSYF